MKRFSGKHTSSMSNSSAKYGSVSSSTRHVEAEATIIPSATATSSMHNNKGATIASAVINLTNTIIGAGMLGLPGAFGGTGYISGMILIVLSAACAAHGLVLLSKVACLTGLPCSFYSVARASVPRYTVLIDAAVAMNCFGVATGYLVTISFSMVKALEQVLITGDSAKDERFLVSILLSRQTWVVGALLSVLPFSFYRTLDDLKKASALALVFVFILASMIIAYANGIADPCMGENVNGDELCKGEVEPYTNFALTVSRLPVFVFAFTCHQNIFPIVNEMEIASQKRFNIIICISIGFALVLYATVAFEGYRTYGSLVRGDILLNYPENKPVTFLRMCIALMLTLHYPLHLDPSRRCLTSLVKEIIAWCRKPPTGIHHDPVDGESSDDPDMEREDSVETSENELVNEEFSHFEMCNERTTHQQEYDDDKLFNVITLTFLILSFVLASIVDDLGVILALVGATGSTLVSFVLPGLIYIKVYPDKDLSLVMAYVQLLLGIVITPLALCLIITEHVNN